MAEEFISSDFCKGCKEGFDKQIEELKRVTEKRLDAHSADIAGLKLLSERLTVVSEQNTELLKELRDRTNEDVKELRAEIKEFMKKSPEPTKSEKKETFWNSEAGKQLPKWVAIAFIIIVIFIVAALVGTNLVEFIKESKSIVPTS
ncbi:MAG: hypothetical protein K0Q47_147 [Sedimentibacter sp.]|jgi:isocitrate dehydrogenase kinase/phosphatase|nr:hypothetical protein [Sedimentibacter sp.]